MFPPPRPGEIRRVPVLKDKVRIMRLRAEFEACVRGFFEMRGFLETRTPLLVVSPGMETHIRPFKVTPHASDGSKRPIDEFLPTSPEFAMKKILANYADHGIERIFQLAPAFRHEPESSTHLPEFVMLEWYRLQGTTEDLMADVSALYDFVWKQLSPKAVGAPLLDTVIRTGSWPKRTVRELFLEALKLDLRSDTPRDDLIEACHAMKFSTSAFDTWDDLFFKLWFQSIEPILPKGSGIFVTHYPASQAALAEKITDEFGEWANRFEVFVNQIEIANAFQELTDRDEQRRRFVKDMESRFDIYGSSFPASPIDEEFLDAVAFLKPCAGIALGLDRMFMQLAGLKEIKDGVW